MKLVKYLRGNLIKVLSDYRSNLLVNRHQVAPRIELVVVQVVALLARVGQQVIPLQEFNSPLVKCLPLSFKIDHFAVQLLDFLNVAIQLGVVWFLARLQGLTKLQKLTLALLQLLVDLLLLVKAGLLLRYGIEQLAVCLLPAEVLLDEDVGLGHSSIQLDVVEGLLNFVVLLQLPFNFASQDSAEQLICE